MYQIAARNLREYHGVPSMTRVKLITTLALLELKPRRLVKQGLAPKGLLAHVSDEAKQTNGAEATSVEDKTKAPNDGGAVSVESAAGAPAPAEKNISEAIAPSPPDADDAVDGGGSAAAKDDGDTAGPAAKKRDILHEAFLAGGINLRPREVRPLLLALDARPCRLAKLGYVDSKDVRAMHQAERANHKRDNNGHGHGHRQRMARGGGSADPAGPTRQTSGAARGLRHGAAGAPRVRGGDKMFPRG